MVIERTETSVGGVKTFELNEKSIKSKFVDTDDSESD